MSAAPPSPTPTEAQASYDSAVASELAALNDLEVKRNKLALQTGVSANRLDPLKASAAGAAQPGQRRQLGAPGRRRQLCAGHPPQAIDCRRQTSGHQPQRPPAHRQPGGRLQRPHQHSAGQRDTRGGSVGVQVTPADFQRRLAQSKVRGPRAGRKARRDLEDARRQVEQTTRTRHLA